MDNMVRKEAVIAKVIAYAKSQVKKDEIPDISRFIEAYYAPYSSADVVSEPTETLFAMTYNLWKLSDIRRKGQFKVKVFNPKKHLHGWDSDHTIIHVVNADMPFLVDSITGLLSISQKHSIYALYHPVIHIARNTHGSREETLGSADIEIEDHSKKTRESFMHIEIERIKDSADLKTLEKDITRVLKDVQGAVKDWKPMVRAIENACLDLEKNHGGLDPVVVEESSAFLKWILADNFTILGYREYHFKGDPKFSAFKQDDASGLGLLRDKGLQVLRNGNETVMISDEIRDYLSQEAPLFITKANVKTTVHRPVHMDYLGLKIFDKKGNVVGERRIVGLFTSQSYTSLIRDVPMLRHKINKVQKNALFGPNSHAGKTVTHILETFPRDELYQLPEDELLNITLGILRLMERPQPKAFIRQDKFERYMVALVYVPRENYNSELRLKIADILCEAVNGEVSVYNAMLTEDVLARWHYIIRTHPGSVPVVDADEINERIRAAAKDWKQHLKDSLITRNGEDTGIQLHDQWANVFSRGYQEFFEPHQAASDISRLMELSDNKEIGFDVYRLLVDDPNYLRLKIYHRSKTVPLSECLPMLENLGLKVISEHSYELQDGSGGCIHDFYMVNRKKEPIALEDVKDLVEELLEKVWYGEIENDGLNRLAIQCQIPATKIVILRAYAKYLSQLGLPYALDSFVSCLLKHAVLTQKLLRIFEIKFSPDMGNKKARVTAANEVDDEVRAALDQISSLDEDRILRGFLSAILATLRTNFYRRVYQNPAPEGVIKPALAFKIRSNKMAEAPKPKPFAEIWVYSPRVEGVHLRGGPVARGGLRWSDRKDDFRTEILGLVKAQQVKNAVIVPVGAKGGFYPKKLPSMSKREAFMEEGIFCYKTFITSLLSVTDNIRDGRIVTPNRIVRWDNTDPYLVVAADKGTATFSDIANGIALEQGFWLGDAFASGGSVGYDHKKMGITAKGAWVSVQRHFREMGINTQTDPITVIGVGDMSGDVFGNGMLLSKTLKVQAAFDHRHIFFDPDPDPAASYKERKRMFKLARSSWEDYNKDLISKGGGIYPRSAKSITLTPEMKKFLGVEANEMAPTDLINRILKAKADLLWFGGIGTYVKSTEETQSDVGDRANDGLRVNATDLKVKVIGEGGNLGMTQRARIEFSRLKGRCNTDFIDNSAGVDCSDKEVNIKILMADLVARSILNGAQRDKVLGEMTDDVSKIVLRDNYLQTQAISIAESQAAKERELHLGLIRMLEKEDQLDREIEYLPSDETFMEMANNNKGLCRPELSTLTCYSKMALYSALLNTKLIDEDIWDDSLQVSFPPVLAANYMDAMKTHQLKREIIATNLANEVVNRGGLVYVYEVREETGMPVEEILSGYILSREAFGLAQIWEDIDKLDYKVSATIQTLMHVDVSSFLRKQTIWFLRNMSKPVNIEATIDRYSDGLNRILDNPEKILSELELQSYKAKYEMYQSHNVPLKLARRIAALEVLGSACDIVNVADNLNRDVLEIGSAFYEVGNIAGFAWLRQQIERLAADNHWDSLAINGLYDDIAEQQRELTRYILASTDRPANRVVASWASQQKLVLNRAERMLNDLKSSGMVTVSKLAFAARHMRSLMSYNA